MSASKKRNEKALEVVGVERALYISLHRNKVYCRKVSSVSSEQSRYLRVSTSGLARLLTLGWRKAGTH